MFEKSVEDNDVDEVPDEEEEAEVENGLGEGGKEVDEGWFVGVVGDVAVEDEAAADTLADGKVDIFVAVPVGFKERREAEEKGEEEEDEKDFVVVEKMVEAGPGFFHTTSFGYFGWECN